MIGNMNYRLKGEYTLTVSREDGTIRKKIGPFPNLITNLGLARITEGTWCYACAVGSGSSTPTVTQTTLDNLLSVVANPLSVSPPTPDVPMGLVRHPTTFTTGQAQLRETLRWRFPIGTVIGNVSEIAVGWQTGSPLIFQAFSRSLILDELGDPTTFTFVDTDILDVEYTLSMYVPTDDVSHSLFIGTDEYSVTYRPIQISHSTPSSSWAIFGISGNTPGGFKFGYGNPQNGSRVTAYSPVAFTGWSQTGLQFDSTVGFASNNSEGNGRGMDFDTTPQVKNGVYSLDSTFIWKFTSANYVSGIGWINLYSFEFNISQSLYTNRMIRIEPAVPKTNVHEFRITVRNTFARYP
jgi:hypothetical protein